MSEFRIAVLASGTGTNLQAILDTLHGREGSRWSGSARTSRARGRWSGPGGGGRDRRSSRATTTTTARRATWRWPTGSRRAAPTSSSSPATCSCSRAAFVARFRDRDRQRPPGAAAGVPGPRRDRPGARRTASRSTGVTVHFVDEGVDTGPIDPAARGRRCPPSRDREELEEAIHAVEHELYPEAIRTDRGGRGSGSTRTTRDGRRDR